MTLDEALQQVDSLLRQIRDVRDVGVLTLRRQGLDATQAHAGMTIRQLFEAMLLIEREPSIASYIFCEYIFKLEDTAYIELTEIGEVLAKAVTTLKLTDTLDIPTTLRHGSTTLLKLTDTARLTLQDIIALPIVAETLLTLKDTLNIPNLLEVTNLTLTEIAEAGQLETVMKTMETLVKLEETLDIPYNFRQISSVLRETATITFSAMHRYQASTHLGLTDTATILLTSI